MVATWAAGHGRGPFVSTSPEENAFSIQVLFIILSVTLLTLSAFVRERNFAELTARTAGEQLRLSRERYRLATAAGSVGVWDWNLETNEIFLDEQLKSMLGYEGWEIGDVVTNWLHHMPPEDALRVTQHAQAYLAGDRATFAIDHRMLHKHGEVRWFAARGTMVHSDDGSRRLVGTETDITVQARARSELEENRRQLTRLGRVAMLGELSGAIAHELSQPLSAIAVNTTTAERYLARRPPELEGLKQIIADISHDNQRAGAVIGRVRSLLKNEGLNRAAVDLNDVVGEVLQLIHAELVERRVRVDQNLALMLPLVLADRVQLQQIILNLVLNACDAMRDAHPAERRVVIGTQLADDGAVLWISDSGPGIPSGQFDQIFEPFVTSKHDGLGLGLAICRTIVTAHGGRIWAGNNPDRGATFSVMLRTAEDEEDFSATETEPHHEGADTAIQA
jgi:PAS domain S-box-containing protein